ncbi:MAG: universal stress protein [Verrucomicrobia bacterium]|nr:universal stress protein [Verrucomicrobiota bacterium]
MRTSHSLDSPASQPASGFKRILALISLTQGLRETLALALKLAKEREAELVVLHIIDLVDIPDEELGMPRDRMLGLVRRDAEKELNQLVHMAESQIPTQIVVGVGDPRAVVEQTAKDLATDLLVTRTHSARQLCQG